MSVVWIKNRHFKIFVANYLIQMYMHLYQYLYIHIMFFAQSYTTIFFLYKSTYNISSHCGILFKNVLKINLSDRDYIIKIYRWYRKNISYIIYINWSHFYNIYQVNISSWTIRSSQWNFKIIASALCKA